MFSECMRVLVAAALACAGVMSVGPVTAAADGEAGGWDRPVVLARRGTSAGVAVAGNGEMAVLVSHWSGGKWRPGLTVVRRTAGGAWESTTVLRDQHIDFADAEYDARNRLWIAWVNNDAKPKVLVRHTRSGAGWTKPTVVAARAKGDFCCLQLELAAPGRATAAWLWESGLELPALQLAERAPSGEWTPAGRFGGVVDFDLALGETGLAAVLMGEVLGFESGRVTISRRPAGGSWETPEELATIPADVQLVGMGGLTVDSSGTTTVVWRDRTPALGWQVFVARAAEGGGWEAPVVLGRRAAISGVPPQVLSTPKGVVLALWNRRDESLTAARYQRGAWGDPARLSGKDAHEWDAALDPTGRAVAVWMPRGWTGELAPGLGVKARLMTRTGIWRGRVDVTSPHARVLGPIVAMNGGDAVVAWWRVITEDPYTFGVSAATHLR